jgi:hypothetical protein
VGPIALLNATELTEDTEHDSQRAAGLAPDGSIGAAAQRRRTSLETSRMRHPLLALALLAAACSSSPTEPFHGTWRVTAVATPGISALSPADAARQVGAEASFDARRARFGAQTCEGVSYTRRVLSAGIFAEAYGVTAQQLRLDTDQIAMVDILCASGSLDAGTSLILRPDGSMLTLWDGVFYEVRK